MKKDQAKGRKQTRGRKGGKAKSTGMITGAKKTLQKGMNKVKNVLDMD